MAWAALVVLGAPGLVTVLVPLVVLAGGFELVFATHVGVERLGRYIAVHHEPAGTLPAWERVAGRLGEHPAAATGIDPLFVRVFSVAALVNLLHLDWAIEPGPAAAAWLLVVAAHAGFGLRLARARRFARTQRDRDEQVFREIGL